MKYYKLQSVNQYSNNLKAATYALIASHIITCDPTGEIKTAFALHAPAWKDNQRWVGFIITSDHASYDTSFQSQLKPTDVTIH